MFYVVVWDLHFFYVFCMKAKDRGNAFLKTTKHLEKYKLESDPYLKREKKIKVFSSEEFEESKFSKSSSENHKYFLPPIINLVD